MIKSINIARLLYAIIVLAFSLFVFQYDITIDQPLYNNFYDALNDHGFVDSYEYYTKVVGAYEPVYFLVCFIFYAVFSKAVLMSALNVVLFDRFLIILDKLNCNKLIAVLFLMSYYFVILFFITDRLKLAFIFLFLGLLSKSKTFQRVFFIVAFFTHFQIIIILVCFWMIKENSSLNNMLKLKVNAKHLFTAVLLFSFLIVVFLVFKTHVIQKFNYYVARHLLDPESIKVFLFFLLCLPVTKEKSKLFYSFSFLLLVSLVIGSGRIVIFSFLLYVYFSLVSRSRYRYFTLFPILGYFSLKGILMLLQITKEGAITIV